MAGELSVTFMHAPRPLAWLPMAALVVASACTQQDLLAPQPDALPALETRAIQSPELSSLRSSAPAIAACGAPVVFPLTNGSRTIGSVSVVNDAGNVYVTYATPTAHWWIANTQLAVEKSAALIPRDASGNAAPWSFPNAGSHEPPVTSFTYSIPLTRVGVQAGGTAYLSAMAGVVHPVNEGNYGGAWEWLVMWGVGNTSSSATTVIHAYPVATCGGQTPSPPPPAPAPTGGVVTITFDDGYATVYQHAYPILRNLGIKANLAVNPVPMERGYPDYMGLAQVQEIHNAGWSVVSHSMEHKDLTTLSAAAMEAEIRDAKAWIVAKGFGPSEVFIVPFHSWGARERAAIAKYHSYTRGRAADEWWPELYQSYPLTQKMDLTAFEPEYAPWRTAQGRAQTMSTIKHVVDNGLYVDLLFHRVRDEDVATFRELMNQVAAYKANIRTWREVVAAGG